MCHIYFVVLVVFLIYKDWFCGCNYTPSMVDSSQTHQTPYTDTFSSLLFLYAVITTETRLFQHFSSTAAAAWTLVSKVSFVHIDCHICKSKSAFATSHVQSQRRRIWIYVQKKETLNDTRTWFLPA